MIYSPLRYPGGKAKLSDFMKIMIDKLDHKSGIYIEPFAGGAGIALDLLFNDYVSKIIINDYDIAIASLWKALLKDNNRFIDKIGAIPLTYDEWLHQKSILENANKYSFELGFAAFYLNRTNRSGILKGGVIGGKNQDSAWKMDARFNRDQLIERVGRIGLRKKDILVYNEDAVNFMRIHLPKYEKNALVYLDPPYFYKGKQLYMNYFNLNDHKRIGSFIKNQILTDWIITYDTAPEIVDIYKQFSIKQYELNYSIGEKRKANEIMIMQSDDLFPTEIELKNYNLNMNLANFEL